MTSLQKELVAWVFDGTPLEPPNSWTQLSPNEQASTINACFTYGEIYPNGQKVRRGRQTNLFIASAAAGSVEFLRYFRSVPLADLTKTTVSELTVFHLALDGETVRHLRSATGSKTTDQTLQDLMTSCSDDGSTPLHCAVGRPSATKALLELGCNPLQRNNGRSIPLHYAGSRQVAELLLNYGQSSSVNTINSLGDTPLHLAISHGSTSVVLVLLKHGADMNLPSHSLSRLNTPMTVTRLLVTLEQQIVKQNCQTVMKELRGLREIKMLFGDWEIIHPLQLKRCCWFSFRTLCTQPREMLLPRSIPISLVDEIIVFFIGPFEGCGEKVYLKEVEDRTEAKEAKGEENSNDRRSRSSTGGTCAMQ